MADALVAPAVAATMYASSISTAAISVKKVRLEEDIKKIPLMGVMSAFVFAAQMVNFTIPGTGSSGHFCGGLLLSILLGPYAGFLSMISVLIVQCLLFGDGGLLALGCNIWNMAFYACFVGYACIYRPMMRESMRPARIFVLSIFASVVSLQLGAFSVTMETLISDVSALSFGKFLLIMQPIHLAIGMVEGVITATVVVFISNTRPELLQKKNVQNRIGFGKMMIILSLIVLFTGGVLSLAASQNPDGLEWSIQNLTGSTQVKQVESEKETDTMTGKAAQIQERTAILPDYSFKSGESKSGTVFAGVVGSVIVVIISMGCCILFRMFRNKRNE